MSKFGVHEDKARRIFQEIDADDTGTLTLEELAAVAQQVMSARVDNKKQENKCVNTSKGIAEYLLSFLWRSLPDLAAETREADELTAAVHRKRRTDGEEPPILQTPIASRSTIVPPTTNRFPISHATAPAAAPEFELVGPSPAPSPPEPGTYEEEEATSRRLAVSWPTLHDRPPRTRTRRPLSDGSRPLRLNHRQDSAGRPSARSRIRPLSLMRERATSRSTIRPTLNTRLTRINARRRRRGNQRRPSTRRPRLPANGRGASNRRRRRRRRPMMERRRRRLRRSGTAGSSLLPTMALHLAPRWTRRPATVPAVSPHRKS